MEEAVFAGGCFWCMEPVFDELPGVSEVSSGYAGGTVPNPSYEEVCRGQTGHLEVIKVVFDPATISYSKLLDLFWHSIDPLDPHGQFCDQGDQYKSAIFYVNEEQKVEAEKSKKAVAVMLKNKTIHTQIRPLDVFYPAEDYHQRFYQTHSAHYKTYRSCSRRDERLKQVWG